MEVETIEASQENVKTTEAEQEEQHFDIGSGLENAPGPDQFSLTAIGAYPATESPRDYLCRMDRPELEIRTF